MRALQALVALIWVLLAGCASTATNDEKARHALAPGGQLRVAFITGPLYATRDPASGELRGVAVDLGWALAAELGVPMQTVVYTNPAGLVAGARSGEWDVALMGVSAERAVAADFSPAYMDVEQGYLVRAGLPITEASEVDRSGVRVGVIENAGADVLLSRTLKNATLVRVKSAGELPALLKRAEADVLAATKSLLYGQLANHPGARVLDGRLLVEPIAMAVPKGRDPLALTWVAHFVEESKASGTVKGAIERAGLRGVHVTEPKK
jgi:polar amino acid transport system substrate-binding protein